MFFLQLEFIYNAINLIFTWTSLANFYLAFFFVSATLSNQLYACSRVSQLVSSATATPNNDAFNFLADGAGNAVFEVILRVCIPNAQITIFCLTSRIALHRCPFCRLGLLAG